MERKQILKKLRVPAGERISLSKDYDPGYTGDFSKREEAQGRLQEGIAKLAEDQEKLYAESKHALLVIFQALDAAGKDGLIKHVMSGINPQGCQVYSFKAPSVEELDHDYLWRSNKALPERGRIGIFNRSYYEEVLVVRVHPEILEGQQLPEVLKDKKIWQRRFNEINEYERYLTNNGVVVLKFFLNVSKAEQKKRFLERIDKPEKNWKFSAADVRERSYWKDYMQAYEDVFNNTSTEWAPWYIIPADAKWFTRLAVAEIIAETLEQLDLKYPKPSAEQLKSLTEARKILEAEE